MTPDNPSAEPTLHTIAARTTDAPVHAQGVLECSDERTMSTTLSAAAIVFVLDYAVANGATVRRGDLIAKSSSPHAGVLCSHERSMGHLLEAQLADARGALTKHEDEATRLGVAAATQRVEQSAAKLQAHEAARDGEEFKSPIDGVVVELDSPGPQPTRAVQVARIVCIDPLRVHVSVPYGAAMPTAGAPCEVLVGTTRHPATVRRLAPMADPQGLPVLEVEVPNPERSLAAGLRVGVRLEVGSRRATFVPHSAVRVTPLGLSVQVQTVRGFEARQLRFLGEDPAQPELEVLGILEGEQILLDASHVSAETSAGPPRSAEPDFDDPELGFEDHG